jgi:hypothetical protein
MTKSGKFKHIHGPYLKHGPLIYIHSYIYYHSDQEHTHNITVERRQHSVSILKHLQDIVASAAPCKAVEPDCKQSNATEHLQDETAGPGPLPRYGKVGEIPYMMTIISNMVNI